MTAADHIVFAELHWTPGILLQAEDRCHRIGQLNPVQIHYLVARQTIDEILWTMVKKKIDVTSTALDGKTSALDVEHEDEDKGNVLSMVAAWEPTYQLPEDEITNVFKESDKLQKKKDKSQRDIREMLTPKKQKAAHKPEKDVQKKKHSVVLSSSDDEDFKDAKRKVCLFPSPPESSLGDAVKPCESAPSAVASPLTCEYVEEIKCKSSSVSSKRISIPRKRFGTSSHHSKSSPQESVGTVGSDEHVEPSMVRNSNILPDDIDSIDDETSILDSYRSTSKDKGDPVSSQNNSPLRAKNVNPSRTSSLISSVIHRASEDEGVQSLVKRSKSHTIETETVAYKKDLTVDVPCGSPDANLCRRCPVNSVLLVSSHSTVDTTVPVPLPPSICDCDILVNDDLLCNTSRSAPQTRKHSTSHQVSVSESTNMAAQSINLSNEKSEATQLATNGNSLPAVLQVHSDTMPKCPNLKSIGEGSDSNMEIVSVTSDTVDDPSWSCSACTFLNHFALSQCEMCETKRCLSGLGSAADTPSTSSCRIPQTSAYLHTSEENHIPPLPKNIQCSNLSDSNSDIDLFSSDDEDTSRSLQKARSLQFLAFLQDKESDNDINEFQSQSPNSKVSKNTMLEQRAHVGSKLDMADGDSQGEKDAIPDSDSEMEATNAHQASSTTFVTISSSLSFVANPTINNSPKFVTSPAINTSPKFVTSPAVKSSLTSAASPTAESSQSSSKSIDVDLFNLDDDDDFGLSEANSEPSQDGKIQCIECFHFNYAHKNECDVCRTKLRPGTVVESAQKVTWRCTNCSHGNSQDDCFCLLCGQDMPITLDEEFDDLSTWNCNECGQINDNQSYSCSACSEMRTNPISSDIVEQCSSKPALLEEATVQWKCTDCFKLNSTPACTVCSAPKPAMPAKASDNAGKPVNHADVVLGREDSADDLFEELSSDTSCCGVTSLPSSDSEYAESDEENDPKIDQMKFCMSQYTDKVYVFDKDSQYLHLRFTWKQLLTRDTDTLPARLRHADNLKQIVRFVNEWKKMGPIQQSIVQRHCGIFQNPMQEYQQRRGISQKKSNRRHIPKVDDLANVNRLAANVGGRVVLIKPAPPIGKAKKKSKNVKSQLPQDGDDDFVQSERQKNRAPVNSALIDELEKEEIRAVPQAVDKDGNPLCLFCCKPITGLRAGLWEARFCSHVCKNEYKIRRRPQRGGVREQLFEMEQGICQICGVDAHAVFLHVMGTPPDKRKSVLEASHYKKLPISLLNRMVKAPKEGQFWEADHITAVSEGGGECGLDNYRTLCTLCHRQVTKQLNQRLAKKRKVEQAQSEGNADINMFFSPM